MFYFTNNVFYVTFTVEKIVYSYFQIKRQKLSKIWILDMISLVEDGMKISEIYKSCAHRKFSNENKINNDTFERIHIIKYNVSIRADKRTVD